MGDVEVSGVTVCISGSLLCYGIKTCELETIWPVSFYGVCGQCLDI